MARLPQIWTEETVALRLEVLEATADRHQMFGEIQEEILIQIEAQMESWHRPKDDCTEVGDKSTGMTG